MYDNIYRLRFSCIILVLILFGGIKSYAQNAEPLVIPKIQQWIGGQGRFKIGSSITIVAPDAYQLTLLDTYLKTFTNDLKALYPDKVVKIKVGKPQNGDIYFSLSKSNSTMSSESYRLEIGEYLLIESSTALGCFWGTRTILQMLEQDSTHAYIPKGIAVDFPKYAVRGFVLDVARKFFTIEFLKSYVKLLSYYKMNDFQIHLNDNGFKQFFNDDWNKTYAAFRLENDTYPGLTAKDGSYSKKEFVELQKLANSYGVTIIPEIDAPAHALSLTRAIPGIASKKYGDDHLDIANPQSISIVHNIFKEYLIGPEPIFINKEVHIGTDEYAKEEAEGFRKFTDSTIRFVESFGKQVRLWGALTHAQGKTAVKSEHVTMNLWYNGYAEPAEMFKLGYAGISTPDQWLYIVPKAGYYFDYLDLEKIYKSWAPNVIGDKVFDENHSQIRGGAFAVWNDHVGNGITEEDVTDRVFPALQVLAQKMWIGNSADSLFTYNKFKSMAKNIGEGPGLNLRAKIESKDSLVMNYSLERGSRIDLSENNHNIIRKSGTSVAKTADQATIFRGGESFMLTPVKEIGFNYTVAFDINPSSGNVDDAIIFSSPKAEVKLKQAKTNMLGFSREGYHYNFNYIVPENVWTRIVISGDNKGTSLYVNGALLERLEGSYQTFKNTKDKMAKVQTLFFPLKYIGSPVNSFKGKLKNLKVFNKVLSAEVVSGI